MTPKEYRRLVKYREFSEGPRACCSTHQGTYRCPLCLVDFAEDSILGINPLLNEEHCIPNGIGPGTTVLACKKCNGDAGDEIDHHLHKKVQWEAFCHAGSRKPLNARMQIAGVDVGVQIQRTGGISPRMDIKIVDRASNPKNVESAGHAELGIDAEMPIVFGPDVVPNLRKARTSLLKSGYLLFFREAGYCGILGPGMEAVRTQIKEPSSHTVPIDCVTLRVPLEALPPRACVVTTPGLAGIAIPVPLSKYSVGQLVILPLYEGTYTNWHEAFNASGERSDHLTKLRMVLWNRDDVQRWRSINKVDGP